MVTATGLKNAAELIDAFVGSEIWSMQYGVYTGSFYVLFLDDLLARTGPAWVLKQWRACCGREYFNYLVNH
jgi:hypothetical protein